MKYWEEYPEFAPDPYLFYNVGHDFGLRSTDGFDINEEELTSVLLVYQQPQMMQQQQHHQQQQQQYQVNGGACLMGRETNKDPEKT